MTIRAWSWFWVLLGGVVGALLAQVGLGWALLGVAAVTLVAGWLAPLATRELTEQAQRLANGHAVLEPVRSRVQEVEAVGGALRKAADNLARLRRDAARDHDEMETLLDSMSEGVVELSEDARLVRANEAAKQILELREPKPFAPIETLIRDSALRDALEEAVIRPFDPVEVTPWDRTIMVRAQTLPKGGAIVTLQDLTDIRRLERVRTDFVANASHELKTPLTALRGFAETLLDDEPPPEIRRNFVQAIGKNAIRLQHLVEDLLDLSRLESGGWRADLTDVDLAASAHEAWEETLSGRDRDVRFAVEGDGSAWADERAVMQIYTNLFDNALRYTPDGGSVSVRIRPGRERIEVAVADTGSGIPPNALPRIFERFYRVDPARSRAEGGTGLGLSIVSHLVRVMGGAVGAASRPGDGTTVTFTLPRHPEDAGSEPAGGSPSSPDGIPRRQDESEEPWDSEDFDEGGEALP